MTGTMIFATVFEAAAVILLIFGFLNENKIIEFEDRAALAIAKIIRRHLKRRQIKRRAAERKHLKVVSSDRAREKSFSRIA